MHIADFFDNSESLWPLSVFIALQQIPPNGKLPVTAAYDSELADI
jgi:hypothetical protein